MINFRKLRFAKMGATSLGFRAKVVFILYYITRLLRSHQYGPAGAHNYKTLISSSIVAEKNHKFACGEDYIMELDSCYVRKRLKIIPGKD